MVIRTSFCDIAHLFEATLHAIADLPQTNKHIAKS